MDSLAKCNEICVNHPRCLSYNYQFATWLAKHKCEINDATATMCPQDMFITIFTLEYRYYEDRVNEKTSCCITKLLKPLQKKCNGIGPKLARNAHNKIWKARPTIPCFYYCYRYRYRYCDFFLLSLQFACGKNAEKNSSKTATQVLERSSVQMNIMKL